MPNKRSKRVRLIIKADNFPSRVDVLVVVVVARASYFFFFLPFFQVLHLASSRARAYSLHLWGKGLQTMSFLSPEGLPQDAQGQDRDGQARLMTDADGVARLMTDQVNAPVVEAVPPSSQPSSSRLDTNGTPLRAMNLDSFASGAETASIFNQTASPFIESMLPISTQAFDQSSTMPSVARHGGEQVPVENGARDPAQIPQDPWQSSQPPPLDPRSGPYAASEHLSTQYLRTRSPSPSRNNHFLSNGNKGLSLALSPSIPSSSPSSSRSSSVGESSRLGEYRPQGRQGVKTGLVYSHLMMLHTVPGVTSSEEGGDFHPEQPDRISRIFDYIKDHGCVAHMKRIQIREVKREEILLVHDAGMWEGIEKTACECLDRVLQMDFADRRRFRCAECKMRIDLSLHHRDVGVGNGDIGTHRVALHQRALGQVRAFELWWCHRDV